MTGERRTESWEKWRRQGRVETKREKGVERRDSKEEESADT